MGLTEHGRQPVAVEAERGAQAGRPLVAGELVAEGGPQHVAGRRAPLHLAVDAREVDGPHDAAVAQRVGVAVRRSRRGRGRLRPSRRSGRTGSWRCRCGTACPTATAAWPPARTPGSTPSPQARSCAGVVDLVEDHHPVGGQPAQGVGRLRRGDLLVGGDEAVDVAGQALARRPVGIELEAEPVGGERPLDLEVARRSDHHEPTAGGRSIRHPVGERRPGAGQGERRLAGARGGDREEVRIGRVAELVEGRALPRTEGDGRHGGLPSVPQPKATANPGEASR